MQSTNTKPKLKMNTRQFFSAGIFAHAEFLTWGSWISALSSLVALLYLSLTLISCLRESVFCIEDGFELDSKKHIILFHCLLI